MTTNPHPRIAPPARRRLWLSWLLSLLVLLTGMGLGSLGTLLAIRRVITRNRAQPGPAAERLAGHLRRTLDLSDEQAARVRGILETRLEAIRAVRADVLPRVREQLRRMHDDVAAELTPEQRPRWSRRSARWQRLLPIPPPETTGTSACSAEHAPGPDPSP